MAATMEDVANRAAVSVATVSRVLNTPEKVNRDTRKRVLEAITALDYRINTAARSLRTQQTRHLGILLPNLADPRLTEAIEITALQQGFTTLICTTQSDPERTRQYLDLLSQQRRVDGLIWIAPEVPTQQVEQVISSGLAVVLINYPGQFPALNFNYNMAAYRGATHLLDLGHRQLALVTGSANQQWWQDGYTDAFADFYLDVDRRLIYPDVKSLFEAGSLPTAIITFDDEAAAQIYTQARERGLRIPNDLSIIGCGDLPFASYLAPGLTTLQFPVSRIAEQAVNRLLHHFHNPTERNPLFTLIEPKLILRESTTGLRPHDDLS